MVDKPAGWTSHDVVGKLRRLARTRKVGHAGTLDPMATGVLICGIGRATRLLGHLALTDKTYTATIRLGVVTSTDDAEGEVVAEHPVSVSDAALATAMATLTGEIAQVPS
ncbi:MAG: tRNA pseudouridine55 synthase, partial [Frankiaceae bacterium]|nr:tRNA pseudouridine55 synthase [Frankiaceae bacterium]